jgi:hypothetical protein
MKNTSPMVIFNNGKNPSTIEVLADFATMQEIVYHENGKVARIVFRSADEIINIAAFIDCHLAPRVPDAGDSAASTGSLLAQAESASEGNA